MSAIPALAAVRSGRWAFRPLALGCFLGLLALTSARADQPKPDEKKPEKKADEKKSPETTPKPPPRKIQVQLIGMRTLTPAVRARIDRSVMRTPLETLSQEAINLSGNVAFWAMKYGTLTEEEEAEFAAAGARQVVKRWAALDTPPVLTKTLEKLVAAVPPGLKPKFRYRVTLIDSDDFNAFTVGGGFIFITKRFLNTFSQAEDGGEAALAQVLAHELGHIVRLHCRRGYQLEQLRIELLKGTFGKVDPNLVAQIFEVTLRPVGDFSYFFYSRNCEYESDHFAQQLCVAAGYDFHKALDGFRLISLMAYPRLLDEPEYVPDPAHRQSLTGYLFTSHPDPVFRLKRGLTSLTGEVEGEQVFGLFGFDKESGEMSKADTGVVTQKTPLIVFVHGLDGGMTGMAKLMRAVGDKGPQRLAFFRYPSTLGPAHAGLFLQREMKRVCRSSDHVVFVCHGTGGLAFRYYAEKLKGGFKKAVFLGTPHAGTDLGAVRFLLSLSELVGDLKSGAVDVLGKVMPSAHSEVAFDIEPDSLFLRHLGQDPALAEKYYTAGSSLFGSAEGFIMQTTFASGKRLVRTQINNLVQPDFLRLKALRALDQINLPKEILAGDGVVPVGSSVLRSAGKQKRFDAMNHLDLLINREVFDEVVPVIVEE